MLSAMQLIGYATIFKYGLIKDPASQNVFSFHQHMCYLERGKERLFLAGPFTTDGGGFTAGTNIRAVA